MRVFHELVYTHKDQNLDYSAYKLSQSNHRVEYKEPNLTEHSKGGLKCKRLAKPLANSNTCMLLSMRLIRPLVLLPCAQDDLLSQLEREIANVKQELRETR